MVESSGLPPILLRWEEWWEQVKGSPEDRAANRVMSYLSESGDPVAFVDPGTGDEIGTVTFEYPSGMLSDEQCLCEVSNALALSCLQSVLDQKRSGVRIISR